MSISTRFPIGRLVILGGAFAITAACSSADTEARDVTGAESSTQLAASEERLSDEVSRGLRSLRHATERFRKVDAAIAAGYAAPAGIPCVASPLGTMGVHVVKAALLDQAVIPNQPELLLYLPKKHGKFKLVGVEYLVPALVRAPNGSVSPWFAMTPWPADYTLITPRPSVFGEPFEGPMPPHEPGTPWHYDKHVWAWDTNPSGMFSQWNPSISCPS